MHARMHLRAAGVRMCYARAGRPTQHGTGVATCASGPITAVSVPQLAVPSCPSWPATPRPHVSTLPHFPAPAMSIVCP